MSWVIMLFVGLLIIPSILIIVVPLTDNILNSERLGFFNSVLSGLNVYLGTTAVNYILIILGLVFFLYFLKFIFSKISSLGK